MSPMTSSLNPLGTVSASMSVTKPHLYARLTSDSTGSLMIPFPVRRAGSKPHRHPPIGRILSKFVGIVKQLQQIWRQRLMLTDQVWVRDGARRFGKRGIEPVRCLRAGWPPVPTGQAPPDPGRTTDIEKE